MAYNPGANVNKAYEEYLKQLQAKPAEYKAPAPYAPSQAVQGYLGDVETLKGSKPGPYQSQYQPQLDDLYNQIVNRQPFKYDLNADMLYQQYKDRYTQQANMGMKDTMGQAAALTGGYGNTYAQTAGQQTYDRTMQGLNDIVPALEERAYGRYQGEGADLYNKLGAGQSMDATAYGRYRDEAGDWRQDYGMAQDLYANERAFDYGQFQDARNFDYGAYRDTMSDWMNNRGFAAEQYGQERAFDYGTFSDQRNYDFQQSQFEYQKQYDTAQQAFQNAQFEWQKATDSRDFQAAEYWKGKQAEAEQAMMAAEQARWEAEFGFQQEQFQYGKDMDAQARADALAAQQAEAAPASTSNSGKTQFNPTTKAAAAAAVKSGGNAGLQAYVESRIASGMSVSAGAALFNMYKVSEAAKDKFGPGSRQRSV